MATPESIAGLELAAAQLVHRFAQMIDDRRIDECASLFTPDAVYRMGRHEWQGRDAIAEMLRSGYPPSVVGLHQPATPVIEALDEPIRIVTSFQFFERRDGTWRVELAGRYHDTVVEQTGPEGPELRFSERFVRVVR